MENEKRKKELAVGGRKLTNSDGGGGGGARLRNGDGVGGWVGFWRVTREGGEESNWRKVSG